MTATELSRLPDGSNEFSRTPRSKTPGAAGSAVGGSTSTYCRTMETPVKKLLIASMLAAFSAAVILPVVSNDAFAAAKKKTKTEKPMKKTPGKT